MQLAVFRIEGELYCFTNICPHRHQPKIYDGIIKDSTVTCPEHGWTYSILNGDNTNQMQGIRHLKKYRIFEENGLIFIEKPALEIPKWRQI